MNAANTRRAVDWARPPQQWDGGLGRFSRGSWRRRGFRAARQRNGEKRSCTKSEETLRWRTGCEPCARRTSKGGFDFQDLKFGRAAEKNDG